MRRYFNTLLFLPFIVMMGACLKDDPFKLPYAGFEPVTINDEWVNSGPEEEAMDRALIDKAFQLLYMDTRFTMARSLLVIRNGKLVAEAYPHDPMDMDRIANIQSMTKSFTSILTGIALEQHILDSIQQTFYSIYPEHFIDAADKQDIALYHALTMTTGIDFDNSRDTKTLYETEDNSVSFVLSRPLEYEPGIVFHYHDGSPHLVSAAIQHRYGKSFSTFADDFLFKPLGITSYQWEAAHDGNTFGAFSLYLKPRDLAKFGQLLLQKGTWEGEQLVDSAWIHEATQPVVNSSSLGAPYGYYFWIYPAYGAYAAEGHGGQRIMVFPEKNLVIVYTAWGYTSSDFFDQFNEIADLISSSCL